MMPLRPRTMRNLRSGGLLVLLAALLSVLATLRGVVFVATPQRAVFQPRVGVPAELRSRHVLAARGGEDGAADADDDDDDDEEYEFNPHVLGMAALQTGQQLSGVVTKILPFGALVDVGAERDGLVPLSKLRQEFTDNAEDVVKVGDGVTCWVAEVNGDKLTLSLVQSKAFPRGQGGGGRAQPARADVSLFESVPSAEWLTGRVVDIQNFGAFVAVKPPSGGDLEAQGLVHITQIKDGFVNDVSDEVQVGQEVQVRVQSVDVGSGRLSLTMRTEAGGTRTAGGGGAGGRKRATDLSAFEGISSDEFLAGTVVSLENYGAFVEVSAPSGGDPVQGLVHISQIKDGFLEDVGEELEEGQDVKVRVISMDDGKLSLSMRQPAAAE